MRWCSQLNPPSTSVRCDGRRQVVGLDVSAMGDVNPSGDASGVCAGAAAATGQADDEPPPVIVSLDANFVNAKFVTDARMVAGPNLVHTPPELTLTFDAVV